MERRRGHAWRLLVRHAAMGPWTATLSQAVFCRRGARPAPPTKSVETDAMTDTSDPLQELAARLLWRPIESAPKDCFILLYCAEDQSRWLAKWQGSAWFGVDDQGLTRVGHSAGDPNVVAGWFLDAWMPLPEPPFNDEARA